MFADFAWLLKVRLKTTSWRAARRQRAMAHFEKRRCLDSWMPRHADAVPLAWCRWYSDRQ